MPDRRHREDMQLVTGTEERTGRSGPPSEAGTMASSNTGISAGSQPPGKQRAPCPFKDSLSPQRSAMPAQPALPAAAFLPLLCPRVLSCAPPSRCSPEGRAPRGSFHRYRGPAEVRVTPRPSMLLRNVRSETQQGWTQGGGRVKRGGHLKNKIKIKGGAER